MKKTFKTTCSYCGVGCGISITKDKYGNLDLEGDQDSPVNKGMLCSKGLNLHHVVKDQSDRLLYPQMRSQRTYPMERVSWDKALDRAAAVFKTMIKLHGADSVAFYVSGQLLTEEYYLANKLVKGFLGTANIDTNSRLCMSSAVVGYKQALGEDCVPINYDDIEESECFLIAGANPAWCHPILFRRIENHKQKNPETKLIVVDPRRTQSAEIADIHVQIQPGTDVTFFNAVAACLIQRGLIDHKFIEEHTNGFLDILKNVKEMNFAESANICRIPESQIYDVAEILGNSKFLSMWAMGLNQAVNGVDKNLALLNLHLLTGKIGKLGCGPFSLTGQPNAMGGREVGGLANMLAAHRNLENPQHRKEVSEHWGVENVPEKPGLSATEMVDALESGKLKAIWIICTNPAVSLPNLGKLEKALKKAKFVVVQDISAKSDTLDFADLILPAAGWMEKQGTMTNSDRRITYLPKIIDAPGEALPDGEILCKFAEKMGFKEAFQYKDESEIFAEHAKLTAGTNLDITGVSYERLKMQGSIQWPCSSKFDQGTKRLFEDSTFYTKDGKAQMFSVKDINRENEMSEDYPFILTSGRIRDQWHTMTRTGKVNKLNQHLPEPFLEINPIDAAKLKLKNNDFVRISNSADSVEIKAKITETIKENVVFMPIHWGKIFGKKKSRVNNLTTDKIDPISKEPDYKFSAVKLEKIAQPAKKIVIIGAGAAALEFIQTYRKLNTVDEIHVFGKEKEPFYNRILLPDYINDEKKWDSLITADAADVEKLQAIFHSGCEVSKIDRKKQYIETKNDEIYPYDKLILATGSRPIIPKIQFDDAQGIFGLRTRKDAENIKHYLHDGGNAVIIGGGLLGLELAGSLAQMKVHVTLIQRSSRLMRAQLDEMGTNLLHNEIMDRNIDVIYNDELKSVYSEKGRLKSIRLRSDKSINCDALFFAIGIQPNKEIGVNCGLKFQKGLLVDNRLTTSDASIHAIGEIAEFKNQVFGTTAAAQDQAKVLAKSLAGDSTAAYEGSLDFNILKIHGLNLCSIGKVKIPPNDSSYEEVTLLDKRMNYYKKCVIRNNRLVGAILIGDKSEFPEFKNLIETGLELGDKREKILKSIDVSEPPIGEIVCACNNVGEGNIVNLIKEGCTDFDELCQKSCAGTGCGSCKPEVIRLLDKTKSKVPK